MRKVAPGLGLTLVLLTALTNSISWAETTGVEPAATALAPAANQQYLVIGSFAQRENAQQWAALNADFGTSVQRIRTVDGSLSFRVLVGPLSIEETPLMQTMLDAVGVAQQWPLPVCTTAPCAGWSGTGVALTTVP